MRAVTHPCSLSLLFGLVPSFLSKAGFLPDIPMATVFPNSTYAAITLPALPSDKRDKNIYFIIIFFWLAYREMGFISIFLYPINHFTLGFLFVVVSLSFFFF